MWRNETNYTTDKIPRTRVPFVGTLTLVSRNLEVGSFGLPSLLAFFLDVTFAHNTLTIQRKRKLIQSITNRETRTVVKIKKEKSICTREKLSKAKKFPRKYVTKLFKKKKIDKKV